jgi:alpha-mannosidase
MNAPKRAIFHLLPNAHLDPVWLWDWREGLNEGIITVRTMLNLMDEFPELTFIRGESAIYEHIEKTDPATFRRLTKMIDAGRWDPIGGTHIQPDSNLTSTEVLCRQFEHGLAYFESRFGRRPTISWQADSFGHTPGWPNILEAFGMEGFAFSRPMREQFPLSSPLFWWEGDHRNRLLCYRQHWKYYCNERENLIEVLNFTQAEAARQPFRNVGIFMGLGDHGGGTSRRHILDVEQWRQAHPDVEVRFSTLHGFFKAIRGELRGATGPHIPVVSGDLGYTLRGCYASVAKFKYPYRRTEALVAATETLRAAVGTLDGKALPDLGEAWTSLLFNAFHDILPGSSIERAFDEQAAWLGVAQHRALEVQFAALNQLAAQVDTSVPPARSIDRPTEIPFLIWNPLPRPFKGHMEIEGSLDYRPIWEFQNRASETPVSVADHRGRPLPFQIVETEHTAFPEIAWRRRAVVSLEIPALGWAVVRMGWPEKAATPRPVVRACRALAGKRPSIANDAWEIAVEKNQLIVRHEGKDFFLDKKPLELRVVEDVWGSWGAMDEEKEAFRDKTLETWKLRQSAVLEEGPLRAKLWTRWSGRNSWVDLTFSVTKDQPWLKIDGRLLWNERSARLKLVLPSSGKIEFDAPASTAVRELEGDLPMGRWVRRTSRGRVLGLASDVLGSVDAVPGELRVTLARASRYANSVPTAADAKMWQPAVDCGELTFQIALFGGGIEPDRVADALLFPPTALTVPPAPGALPSTGSLGELSPSSVRLLTLERLSDGQTKIRVENRSRRSCKAVFTLAGHPYSLGLLASHQIKTLKTGKKHRGE